MTFSLIILVQANNINVLRGENKKSLPDENKDELIATASKKLKSFGDIKTVTYLREEKGMSMVDAKQLVDTLQK